VPTFPTAKTSRPFPALKFSGPRLSETPPFFRDLLFFSWGRPPGVFSLLFPEVQSPTLTADPPVIGPGFSHLRLPLKFVSSARSSVPVDSLTLAYHSRFYFVGDALHSSFFDCFDVALPVTGALHALLFSLSTTI